MIDPPELILGAPARLERTGEIRDEVEAQRRGADIDPTLTGAARSRRGSTRFAGRARGRAERESKQKDRPKEETAKVAQERTSVILCLDGPA